MNYEASYAFCPVEQHKIVWHKLDNSISVGCSSSNDQTTLKRVNWTKCTTRLDSSNGKIVKLSQTVWVYSLHNLSFGWTDSDSQSIWNCLKGQNSKLVEWLN